MSDQMKNNGAANVKAPEGKGHRTLTIIGIVLCVILVPILIVNCTLIVKSYVNKDEVPEVVVLYALLDLKGVDKTISFNTLLDLSLLFCMTITEFIGIIKKIEEDFSDLIF